MEWQRHPRRDLAVTLAGVQQRPPKAARRGEGEPGRERGGGRDSGGALPPSLSHLFEGPRHGAVSGARCGSSSSEPVPGSEP